jgi:hypothetical protein
MDRPPGVGHIHVEKGLYVVLVPADLTDVD